jgi:hypothetical protein
LFGIEGLINLFYIHISFMKRKSHHYILLTAVLLIVAFSNLRAQGDRPRESPKMTATGKIGAANVSITYSSPSVKGRKIWGGLVPYDKVWRAGANEATIIETDKDLVVGGKKLPAGKYSLYTLPGEKQWQIIFNSQTGQWGIQRTGETTRNAEKDVAVVTVTPKKSSAMAESMVYTINNNGFALKWENLEVPVPVK